MKKRPLPKGVKINSKLGERVFKGERFDVYQWDQEEYGGKKALYEIVKRNDSVCIIPVVNDEVYIVKETQPHWAGEGLCLIAGGLEEGEDLELGARRELLEETGMIFDNFYLVGVEQLGFIEWFRYIFVATGYRETKQRKLDPGERIEVLKIKASELIPLARSKGFLYSQRFIEDFIIQDKIPQFFDLLKNPKQYEI